MQPKDIGTGTTPAPSPNNEVTVTRYRVTYRRSDGRNTPGVDVPYAFDGAATGTIPSGGALTLDFELVRHVAKEEPPLAQLASNPTIISTITEITLLWARSGRKRGHGDRPDADPVRQLRGSLVTRTAMRQMLSSRVALLGLATFAAACTIKETPAPPLTGPSEYALSLTIAAVPDLVTRDGVSQSTIVVTARDYQGAPIRSQQLRLDMVVNGAVQDFGSLSTKTLFTNADGRATAIYTAPPAPATGSSSVTDRITFIVSPVGTNQQASTSHVRRHPPGHAGHQHARRADRVLHVCAHFRHHDRDQRRLQRERLVPGCRQPHHQLRLGLGRRNHRQLQHQPVGRSRLGWRPGSYSVTLTVTDDLGQRASTTQTITVG